MFSKRGKDEGFVNRFNKREFQLVKNENLKEILAQIINKNKGGGEIYLVIFSILKVTLILATIIIRYQLNDIKYYFDFFFLAIVKSFMDYNSICI